MSDIGKQIRQLKKDAENCYRALGTELVKIEGIRGRIPQDLERIRMEVAERVLDGTDIDVLAAEAKGVRFAALKGAGYRKIGDIRGRSEAVLTQVKGIGPEGAAKLKEAAENYAKRTAENAVVRIDASHKTSAYTILVRDLYAYRHSDPQYNTANALQRDYENACRARMEAYEKATSFVSRIFSFGRSSVSDTEIASFIAQVRQEYIAPATSICESFRALQSVTDRAVWDDFEKNVAAYYSLIDTAVPQTMLPKSTQTELHGRSGISEELVGEIGGLELDTKLMKSTLRRYQSFGTKYIIHQKRTLLGDEMGLGKTIQAIAAIAHLKSRGRNRFVVVCPLSVLVNWAREIEKHSELSAIAIHGSDRQEEYDAWMSGEAVAVTTYETLDKLPFPEVGMIDMLVVDEAHNVKNPNAKRTKHVQELISVSEYVLYMTGTPLENRVDEMRFLLGSVSTIAGNALRKVQDYQEKEFKAAIAGTYLRRVREDVLKELPELIDVEDWLILNDAEKRVYRQSLFSEKNNFMAVRRVSWNVEQPVDCGKLQKLKEICEDAREEGRKVIVFSYFRDTLERVAEALGEDCTGIIHGGVKTEDRQAMIDVFAQAQDGAVLVAQIEAGGVGLNIQAASVVILCEPQFKPSTENQAISRAYRMGQARGVTVHRLLMKDTIDERMRALVLEKGELFETYAQRSEAGDRDLKLNESAYLNDMIEEERKKYAASADVISETAPAQDKLPETVASEGAVSEGSRPEAGNGEEVSEGAIIQEEPGKSRSESSGRENLT